MLHPENAQKDLQNVKSNNPLKKSKSLPIYTLQTLTEVVADSPISKLFG